MKETIFAKLVSLFDEIKKGIIADEFQEGSYIIIYIIIIINIILL